MSEQKPAQKLASFVHRIEHLEAERKSLGEDIKYIYHEAKAAGFDPTHVHAVVKARKTPPHVRDELTATQNTYLHAVESVERALPPAVVQDAPQPSAPEPKHHESQPGQ